MIGMTFLDKIKTFSSSIVAWAAILSVVITTIMTEVQGADWFPEDAAGQVVKWGAIALGVIATAVKVLTQVTPVPAEGMEVVAEDGDTISVNRGWE